MQHKKNCRKLHFLIYIGLALVNDMWLCAVCNWWPRSSYVAHSTYWILSYYNYSIATVHVTFIKTILFAKSQIGVTIGIWVIFNIFTHHSFSHLPLHICTTWIFCQKNMSFENIRSGYFIVTWPNSIGIKSRLFVQKNHIESI